MVDSGNIFIDHDETRYFYVYEVYFDKPIVTSDSFYVALTQQSRQMDSIFVGQGEIVTCFHNEYGPSLRYLAIPTDSVIQNLSDSVFDALYGNGYAELDLHYQWHFYTQSRNGRPGSAMTYLTFPCLFPIIDTTGMGLRPVSLPCDEVTGLNVASTWDRNALLRWDGGRYNDKWELAVGRADADPSTYHVYPVTVTNKVLSDLDSNVVYAARVRAECFPNGRNYSGWSDTVPFNIGMSQEVVAQFDIDVETIVQTLHQSIVTVPVHDTDIGQTYVIPNPPAFVSGELIQLPVHTVERRRTLVQIINIAVTVRTGLSGQSQRSVALRKYCILIKCSSRILVKRL